MKSGQGKREEKGRMKLKGRCRTQVTGTLTSERGQENSLLKGREVPWKAVGNTAESSLFKME